MPKKDMPFFYKEMIKCWEDISKSEPQTVNSIFAQKICLNACILVDNNPVSWKISSAVFVMDFYKNDGTMLDWTSFKNKFNLQNGDFFKFTTDC